MRTHSYGERDYAFGQAMLSLRTGSVRPQNTTWKAHSKWGNHCQNGEYESKLSPFCGLSGETFHQSPELVLSSDTSKKRYV
jgi:hypothetical protein